MDRPDSDSQSSLTLTTVLNPWQPQTTREVRLVLHAPGRTVAEYLQQAGIAPQDGIDLAVSWNGRVLTDAECARLTPRPGDCVAITARPHGGGGGGGKNPVAMVAMIALMVVAIIVTFGWAAAGIPAYGAMLGGYLGVGVGIGNALVYGGIMVAGSLMISAVMPGPKAETGAGALNWGEDSPSYGWDRAANLMREGLAIPVIYGTMQLTPPVIAANVQAAADGSEYLNVLCALGEGPLSIEPDADYGDQLAVYLNEQHFSVFARSVTQQASQVKLLGTPSASSSAPTYYPGLACDGNIEQARPWTKASGDGSPWWKLDLGASGAVAVCAYNIRCGGGSAVWSWTLAGSNDDSAWTTLDTKTDQSLVYLTRYTFANTTEYRYYRLSGLSQIVEVQFFAEDTSTVSAAVAISARGGDNIQDVIPQFRDTYAMEAGWSAVKLTTTYTERELTGTAIAGIVVGLAFPYGLYTVDAAGNKGETSVSITLQYCTYSGGWGSWTDWGTFSIAGAKTGAYKWCRELLNLTAGRYKVRAKFASEPPTGINYVNTAYWEYAQTVIPDDFAYPNTALLGLRVLATDQLSGGMPRVTALVTQYAVTVDVSGTPTDKPANNPAWAAYDILANTRYGAGVDTDDLIYAEFAAWAAYCEDPDGLDAWNDATAYIVGDRILPTVPAGFCYRCTTAGTSGGTEPTWPTADGETVADNGVVWTCEDYGFRIDIVFDTATSIVSALSDLAVAGHGIVVQRGSQYGVIIDQPVSPTQMFGMGNVVKDSFKIDYLNLEDRANVVEITYWDRDRDYQRTTIEVRSTGFDAGTDAERNAPAVTLYGCTSRRTAIKYGRYMLRQNALTTHVISFEAGVDAIAVLPGDVFKFSHDVPQWQYSGRITAVVPVNGSSVTEVTLDQAIYCEAAKSYQIQVRESNTSDALLTLALDAVAENGSYDTFTLTAPATGTLLPEDVYIFGETTETTQLYRVLSISRAQDQTRKITAALYDASAYVDTDAIPAPEAVTSPTGVDNLRVTEVVRDGQSFASLVWDGSATDWTITLERQLSDGSWAFDRVESANQHNHAELATPHRTNYRFTVRSIWPADSEQATFTPLHTREWDFDLFFDLTFDDYKPDRTHALRIGWRDKDHRDVSDCVEYIGPPSVKRGGGGTTYLENYYCGGDPVPNCEGNWWRTTETYNSLPVWETVIDSVTWKLWAHLHDSDVWWTISEAAGNVTNEYWRKSVHSATPTSDGYSYTATNGATGDVYIYEGLTAAGYSAARRWPWIITGNKYYVEDYRDVGSYAPWYLYIDIGVAMGTATLRWDSASIPAEHAMYLQEVDADGVPTGTDIDMSAQETLTITADCKYRIHLAVATEEYELTIKPGWNLVSVPLYPITPDPDVVFADSDIDYVQEWDPATAAFVDAVVILPKVGYWIHSNQGTDITVTVTGWRAPSWVTRYLQGPATDATEHTREAIGFCAAMANMFPACTKGYLQQFNATTGTYETVLVAAEGVGYWIDVIADGQIIVNPR